MRAISPDEWPKEAFDFLIHAAGRLRLETHVYPEILRRHLVQ
jgi:hypothetical protein